jgi:hypothetical protein
MFPAVYVCASLCFHMPQNQFQVAAAGRSGLPGHTLLHHLPRAVRIDLRGSLKAPKRCGVKALAKGSAEMFRFTPLPELARSWI